MSPKAFDHDPPPLVACAQGNDGFWSPMLLFKGLCVFPCDLILVFGEFGGKLSEVLAISHHPNAGSEARGKSVFPVGEGVLPPLYFIGFFFGI